MPVAPQEIAEESSSIVGVEEILQAISGFVHLIFGGAFTGIALTLASTQLPGPFKSMAGLLGGLLIALSLESKRWYITFAKMIFYTALVVGSALAMRALAGLATAGAYGPDKTTDPYSSTQIYLIAGMLWLLFGVPGRAFKFRLDHDGKGTLRDTLTNFLALAASVLAGTYIIILHYGGGPFQDFNFRALIVGDILTIVLLPPIFRSIAESSWTRGPIGLFSPKPLVARWLKAGTELDEEWAYFYRVEFSKTAGGAVRHHSIPTDDSLKQAGKQQVNQRGNAGKTNEVETQATGEGPIIRKTKGQHTSPKAVNRTGSGARPPRNKAKKRKGRSRR